MSASIVAVCRYCAEPVEHVVNRSGYTGWRHVAYGFIYCPGDHQALPGANVTAQSSQRPGRSRRWAYVIHGRVPYVSDYRYHSEAAALAAGRADADASEPLIWGAP